MKRKHLLEHETIISTRLEKIYSMYGEKYAFKMKTLSNPDDIFFGYKRKFSKVLKGMLPSIMAFGRKYMDTISFRDRKYGRNVFKGRYIADVLSMYPKGPFNPHVTDLVLDIGKPPFKIYSQLVYQREGLVGKYITNPIFTRKRILELGGNESNWVNDIKKS